MAESNLIEQITSLIQQKQYDEARAIVTRELKQNPNNADGWYLVAVLANTPDRKLQALERALSVDPTHDQALQLKSTLVTADKQAPPNEVQILQTDKTASPKQTAVVPSYIYALAGFLLFLIGVVMGMIVLTTLTRGEILGVVLNPTATFTFTASFTPTNTLTPTVTTTATATLTETPIPTTTPRVPPSATLRPPPTITPTPIFTPTRAPASFSQDYEPLDFLIIDAEYSNALDRIIMISANPNVVRIFDPVTMTSSQIDLPRVPQRLSVSADGRTAAVSHDSMITHVDLEEARVINSWIIAHQPPDIVMLGNMVYFPSSESFNPLVSLNLDTGTVSEQGAMFRHINNITRHPNEHYFYGITVGVSPSDIYRGEDQNGTLVAQGSPYHGDYRICGLVTINPSGSTAVTSCGTMFAVGRIDGDMQYAGTLNQRNTLEAMAFIDDERLIATTIEIDGDQYDPPSSVYLNVYSIQSLGFVARHYMGLLTSNPVNSALVPRFTFMNSAGTEFYVLSVQTDSGTFSGASIYYANSPAIGLSYSLLRGDMSTLLEQ